jgi:GcrA cell cycle regulator
MTIQRRIVDIEASAKLWSEGLSASQIASILGSRNVVIARPIATVSGSHRARSEAGAFEARADTSAARAGSGAKARTGNPATAYDAERITHAKLLHELTAGECCWPLNTGGPICRLSFRILCL